jgi:energy-coupling factor transporter ATP-binding protein EcfA2
MPSRQGERPPLISSTDREGSGRLDRSPGGAEVRLEGLSWTPVRRRTPVFDQLDLRIEAGQRVIVAGPSGAGKSTLLRATAGLLLTAAHGELAGRALVGGEPAGRRPGDVALLLQDPLAAVVAETVGRDVAFGLENQRVPRAEIWPRVRLALTESGFPYGEEHPTSALSGGETQRLVLAGALALQSRVLLLDEPTAMLDPAAATAVQVAIRDDVARRGTTLVVVEHHLEPWLDFADRLVVLDSDGRLTADGPPDRVLAEEGDRLAALGVWVPGLAPPEPVRIDRAAVEPWDAGPARLVEANEVTVRLRTSLVDRRAPATVALDRVSAQLDAGRALAVTGASGAGKSTLVTVLAGLQRPSHGSVLGATEVATKRGREPWRWRSRDLTRRLAWVPQVPEHGMVAATVADELLASSRATERDETRARRRADALLEAFGLTYVAGASPYHLSGGEQRRLMVAAGLVHGPLGVLLDEPTVGQDRLTWATVLGAIGSARDAGTAVAIASHDEDAVAAVADDVVLLSRGRLVR